MEDIRKPKLVITVGISASGKSTWAKTAVLTAAHIEIPTVEINRDEIRFNEVKPGSNWSTYKFNRKNEEEVTRIALEKFEFYSKLGYDIIISDTNLNEKYRNEWVKRGEDVGYSVIISEFPITLEEAWKRDSCRENGVGHTVIYQQWLQWQKYKGRKVYEPNHELTKAIIVDIDGTVADKGNRFAFDWDKVDQDTPRSFIIGMINSYLSLNHDVEVVFLSGRDSVCRHKTLTWISTHFGIPIHNIELYMRPEKDQRKDTIIKEELFWEHIDGKYNIIGAFDDRPVILRLWHSLGIPNVICVSDPFIEF